MPGRFIGVRWLIAASLVLSLAGPASAQRRETICLHEASDVCGDLVAKQNAADRLLMQLGDAKLQRACRSILGQQFYRQCAERYLTSPSADRRCTKIFKQFERNYARDIRKRSRGRCGYRPLLLAAYIAHVIEAI